MALGPRRAWLVWTSGRGTCKIPQTACLRAPLIIPALKQHLLLSRGRERCFSAIQRSFASTSDAYPTNQPCLRSWGMLPKPCDSPANETVYQAPH
jgi:hypothetical protein